MLVRFHRFRAAVAGYTLLCVALIGVARAAEPRLVIRSAYVQPVDGIYLLTAQFLLDLPDGARQAVRDGVVFTFDVDLAVHRARRFWLDASIATLAQHYQINFHALSERFVVRNLNSGEQTSYATLDEALESLSSIRGLPVLDAGLIEHNEEYEFGLRAALDVRTLPETLRWILFWKDDWRQRSAWYAWSVIR